IEHLCEAVFEEWLKMAMLSGAVPLPVGKYDKFNAPLWTPRRWSWIDPLKDTQANIKAIDAGLKSRTQVVSEQGLDFDELCEQLAAERETVKKHGLVLDVKNIKAPEDKGNAKEKGN
ncbi:MAG: phage portal protein, partial [FCB group bacterium]|nr:phage portal protein [FCB group bacterium]